MWLTHALTDTSGNWSVIIGVVVTNLYFFTKSYHWNIFCYWRVLWKLWENIYLIRKTDLQIHARKNIYTTVARNISPCKSAFVCYLSLNCTIYDVLEWLFHLFQTFTRHTSWRIEQEDGCDVICTCGAILDKTLSVYKIVANEHLQQLKQIHGALMCIHISY